MYITQWYFKVECNRRKAYSRVPSPSRSVKQPDWSKTKAPRPPPPSLAAHLPHSFSTGCPRIPKVSEESSRRRWKQRIPPAFEEAPSRAGDVAVPLLWPACPISLILTSKKSR